MFSDRATSSWYSRHELQARASSVELQALDIVGTNYKLAPAVGCFQIELQALDIVGTSYKLAPAVCLHYKPC